jgi:hypothetical protein
MLAYIPAPWILWVLANMYIYTYTYIYMCNSSIIMYYTVSIIVLGAFNKKAHWDVFSSRFRGKCSYLSEKI